MRLLEEIMSCFFFNRNLCNKAHVTYFQLRLFAFSDRFEIIAHLFSKAIVQNHYPFNKNIM